MNAKEFNLTTGMTTIRDTTGWWYAITPQPADRAFNYRVEVYLDGNEKGYSFANTKRGCLREARKVRNNHHKRARMTPETGILK